jgi:hydroxymethylpyrimidine pyrophosphatase-like HAD family hydrolase
MLLLATDLDGTFLGGTNAHKQQLYRLILDTPALKLIFVTGRGLGSVMPLLHDAEIPTPDYIICDVGSTVLNGHTLEPIQPLQSLIEKKWPGSTAVRQKLKPVKGLRYQEVPQNRRCSYFLDKHTDLDHLNELATGLGCDVLVSGGKFIDVLPHGVNKGSTLTKLIGFLNLSPGSILVAGDTMNDLSLYETGYKGVVVGEAEELLLDAVSGLKSVYIAERSGAGGILEAMANDAGFHSFISGSSKKLMGA